ncbi:hypothetical protein [Candidatus Tisiphia endosymbiont of Nemotelus uliginosus]|uniref:hypothetical protein n=1 Tax=Candidatus Tisiphia endosymbiont of Nemotelus uliginosus TaxID=3077926 RepID=UPI0035C93C02
MEKIENKGLKVQSSHPIIFTIILIMVFVLSISYMAFYQLDLFKNRQKASATNEIAYKNIVPSDPVSLLATSYTNTILGNNNLKEVSSTSLGAVDNFNESQNNAPLSELLPSSDLSDKPANNLPQKNIAYPSPIVQNNYRNYLLNINLLIANFLQGKHYTAQIDKIAEVALPQDIKNVLADLVNYHKNYLFNNSAKTEKIFPSSPSWLEKFIKVEKKHISTQEQEILKQKITSQLDFIINFFYSQTFQQNFIEQSND